MDYQQSQDKGKEAILEIESLKSSHGHKLSCKYWNVSDLSPRCLVFISHGVAEHSMCYNNLVQKLVNERCIVFSHDHVGHGESEGDKVHVDDFAIYCDDVVSHVKKIKDNHANLPCFIIGHSMGGAIAITTALKNPDLFSGVVLISPAVMIDSKVAGPFKIFISRIVSKVVPQLQVGSISPEWLSKDAEVCKKYLEDPLVWHGGMKAKWGCCMLDAMDFINTNWENIKFPFLILHGLEDKICQVDGSKVMHEKSSSSDKTLKVYEGAYHQVHNEPGDVGVEARKDIVDWIISRSS